MQNIMRLCGRSWGAHLMVVRQVMEGAVIPAIFYAAPVWVTVVRSQDCLFDLERALTMAGRVACG